MGSEESRHYRLTELYSNSSKKNTCFYVLSILVLIAKFG